MSPSCPGLLFSLPTLMSRQWISPRERRGIIVLLAVIVLSITALGVNRCAVERSSRRDYLDRQARLDSISDALRSVPDTICATDSLTDVKPRSKPRRKKARKTPAHTAPVPVRNPIDEPIN